MKISELLDSIRKSDLVLPEFQREYVWTLDQAKQLMVSLAKGYPVGGILLWKTDKPPELKNIDALPEKVGTVQVLLDSIRKSDLVLPEFQREYVWTLDQAKQLMVSLARGLTASSG